MSNNIGLWDKYCSFFEKEFSEQLNYNRRKRNEFFEKWKETKTAEHICGGEVDRFEDVQLTTYDDYPILHEFGVRIERLRRIESRYEDELWWEYYDRISSKIAPLLEGWMPEKYEFCTKTSGTTGKNKWFAHGETFWENLKIQAVSSVVMAASEEWGETKAEEGDAGLNLLAPAPYITGYLLKGGLNIFECVPPVGVSDNIPDMRKKVWRTLKEIKKGKRVDYAGGVASYFHLASEYFTAPEKLFREYYDSMDFGLKKAALLFLWLKNKFFTKKYNSAKEVMPVKGLLVGGTDSKIYSKLFEKEFGVEPMNLYGSTEMGFVMLGPPHNKMSLMPDLRMCTFEFIVENGEIKQIDELVKGSTYEIVVTPYGSMLARYRMEEFLKVVDFLDNGLPLFDYIGRKSTVIDVYGYFRLSEGLIADVIRRSGLPPTNRWTVAKILEPKEHILFLMEKRWDLSEEKVNEMLYRSLMDVSEDFRDFVKDFRINNPSEIVNVEYLSDGAFMKYALFRMKERTPLGQMRVPKIVPPSKMEIVEELRHA